YLTVVCVALSVNAPEYTVPPAVGSEPSVVYLIWATPESASVAESVTDTGLVVNHGLHDPPLHWIDVFGAVPSGSTANEVGSLVRPALLVAVTSLGSAGFAAL